MSKKFKNVDLVHKVPTTNNNETENGSKDEEFKVDVTQYEPFPNLMDIGSLSTATLMKKVNGFFKQVYKDYAGCRITPLPNGAGLNTELFFTKLQQENPEPATEYAFTENAPGQDSPIEMLNKLNSIARVNQRKMFYITKEGKDLLSKFFPGNGKVDWSQVIGETTENIGFTSCTYAIVGGLDIIKILPYLFGDKDDEGNWYNYQLNIARPISQIGANINNLLIINRISNKTIRELEKEVGLIPQNGINIMRV